MLDHQILYIQFNESIKESKPYRAQYLISKKQPKKKTQDDELDSVYVIYFLGTKNMSEQKKRFIEYFLSKYYSKKDNYLWSYHERTDLADDSLIAVINEVK